MPQELRCNGCQKNQNEHCIKRNVDLPSGFAKRFFGGYVSDISRRSCYS